MKSIDCVLTGGLGNQLYSWALASHLAILDNRKLTLHWDSGSRFGITHDSDLREAKVPIGEFCLSSNHLFDRLRIHNFMVNGNLTRRIHQNSDTKIVNQGLVDFKSIKNIPTNLVFGSNFSPESVLFLRKREVLSALSVSRPSSWYREFSTFVQNSQLLGVHVRRGDYSKYMSNGILTNTYYRNAIQAAREYENQKVFVFSDSINEARILLSNIPNLDFIEPPESSRSIESLFLLSKFSSLVVSNSTFSVWSGLLNHTGAKIYYPSIWHPDRPELMDLFPSEWTAIVVN